jgi:hypothetical protein
MGSNANGHAGFNFVKVGDDGGVLPRDATHWPCVHDKVTGLTWENKTHDGGLHDVKAKFKNKDNGREGDASAYVTAVNAAGWCGARDWRLPTRGEMESLVDFSVQQGNPLIDSDWFPRTAAALHWTVSKADTNGGGRHYRWAVNYADGTSIWYGGMYGRFSVRLVRQGNEVPAKRWVPHGVEVLDKSTNLVWRRCAEGQAWSGSRCTGAPSVFLTASDAIEHAKAEAALTGVAWRTPNVKELSSLVDTRVDSPSIDQAVFPGFACGACHTATPWTQNPVYSWRVSFGDGSVVRDFWGGNMVLVRDND